MPTRVPIVESSSVARRMIRAAIEGQGGIEVVGTASGGEQALVEIERLTPDVVTLDIEMPVFDGLQVLEALNREKK